MPAPNYGEPFFWWGPAWARTDWRTIRDLLRDETIDAGDAALIWAALARGRSLVVIAGPSGAGKTTLLGALLDLLPADAHRVYIRGCFETFAFLADNDVVPRRTALIVNEISPHLPVYLWGPAVARLLDCATRGFALLATAHAQSVADFIGMLARPPLRIAATRAAAFEYVVRLDRVSDSRSGRRVGGIWRLTPLRAGVNVAPLSPRRAADASDSTVPFSAAELAVRAALLRDLATGEIAGPSELHAMAARLLPVAAVEPVSQSRVASAQAQPPERSPDSALDRPDPG